MLRNWRVVDASPSGLFVWFDPSRESVELYELEPEVEPRVADASEGDDQRQIRLFQSDQNEVVVVDDLPF